jgi:hypothetical protein
VLVLVAVSGDQVRTIKGAIDGDFAFFSAANGADFLAFRRTESLCFSLFADWAGHVEQNTLTERKFKKGDTGPREIPRLRKIAI